MRRADGSIWNHPISDALERHLCEHASAYFPTSADSGVRVRQLSESVRRDAVLRRLEVDLGDRVELVMAKAFTTPRSGSLRSSPSPRPRRPRLVSRHSGELDWAYLQYTALAAIERHIEGLQDPRFGSVRVLDFLPAQQTMLMEVVDQPSLKTHVLQATRWPWAETERCETLLAHAGAWLRAYHESPFERSTELTTPSLQEFQGYIARVCGFLHDRIGPPPSFNDIADRLVALVDRMVPSALPVGLIHADFAMRNILVSPQDEVTVLDTIAFWRSYVFEDMGYFLADLESGLLPVLIGVPRAREKAARLEQAFLSGYYGTAAIPTFQIGVFKTLALLDRWSSVIEGLDQRRTFGARAVRRGRLAVLSRHLRHHISDVVLSLERLG